MVGSVSHGSVPLHRLDREAYERFSNLFRDKGFEFHEGQRLLLQSGARYKVWIGGRRAGKSLLLAAAIWLHVLDLERIGFPEIRIRLVAPEYSHINEVLNYIKRYGRRWGIPVVRHSDPRDYHWRLGPRARLEPKPLVNPKAHRGPGVTMLVVDECSLVDGEVFHNELEPSTRDYLGQIWIAGTAHGRNWVVEYARAHGIEPHRGLLEHLYFVENGSFAWLQCPSWVNPRIDRASLERDRKRMPALVFDREYGAAIVDEYGHPFPNKPRVVDRPFSPEELRYAHWAIGIDYGYQEPSAIVWVAKCLDGRYRVTQEYYQSGCEPSRLAEIIRSKGLPRGAALVADFSLFNRDGRMPVAYYLSAQGLVVQPSQRDRLERWTLIRELLYPDPEPKIWISAENCPSLIWEFEHARAKRGRPEDIEHPEHALSALGYALGALYHREVSEPIPPESYQALREFLKKRRLSKSLAELWR